jgi:uncharacterized protein YdhG (YjbR/CyaY superfamily)
MKSDAPSAAAIDGYIEGFPPDVRVRLNQMRATVRKAAPMATEKISYQIPTFYYNGNLVHFAAFKEHIGFFPTPSAISAFSEELKPFKSAKGSVQFPLSEPLPLKLIARMVKFRVDENSKKAGKSKSKKR